MVQRIFSSTSHHFIRKGNKALKERTVRGGQGGQGPVSLPVPSSPASPSFPSSPGMATQHLSYYMLKSGHNVGMPKSVQHLVPRPGTVLTRHSNKQQKIKKTGHLSVNASSHPVIRMIKAGSADPVKTRGRGKRGGSNTEKSSEKELNSEETTPPTKKPKALTAPAKNQLPSSEIDAIQQYFKNEEQQAAKRQLNTAIQEEETTDQPENIEDFLDNFDPTVDPKILEELERAQSKEQQLFDAALSHHTEGLQKKIKILEEEADELIDYLKTINIEETLIRVRKMKKEKKLKTNNKRRKMN
ncbi:hypothetical protein GPALN_006965 [Globodera pallida]|nr:hypothetical protein GPALN_006965 [Globodera pallida]